MLAGKITAFNGARWGNKYPEIRRIEREINHELLNDSGFLAKPRGFSFRVYTFSEYQRKIHGNSTIIK